ncbi:MAG: cytochrome c biogenesis protein CcsA [Gemmataceae bacterium]|nr:cytochrome c biogenesis protein CcsA [Gemmataceae bacterium]MDW8264378.1 cytochrome c biogenesis protein CcsA [Gemmataceae bacterium]
MNRLTSYAVPAGIVLLAAAVLLVTMLPKEEAAEELHLRQFGQLPVVDRGRVKPLDTVARTSLLVISKRQTYVDEYQNSQPAIRWLLEVLTAGRREDAPAMKLKVFRIENDEVLTLLGLPPRPGSFRYALAEFVDKIDVIAREANRAKAIDPKVQSTFDAKILELATQLQLYVDLNQYKTPLVVPPWAGGDDWQSLGEALSELQRGSVENPHAVSLGLILVYYSKGDTAKFNQEVARYLERLQRERPEETRLAAFEVFFNQAEPFYRCSLLYLALFLLGCGSLTVWVVTISLRKPEWMVPVRTTLIGLTVVVLALHSWAILARMMIQGRPPVTNLYSSAIFIGWGAVLLCLILEVIFRRYLNGLGVMLGAACGGLTTVIAHHLAQSGDTLEMMQAVLDTNFWLATHVTCITLGYAATFVAGIFGIAWILLRIPYEIWQPRMQPEIAQVLGLLFRVLSLILYATICLATFLSFTGTVLGGIWADYSWGRFWGWDPKENGALLIVLWNALILHARWGGLVKQRGIAVLAVVGNMVTAWSWFGTNQLGVGLHAYGFNNTLSWWLVVFWASQLFFIALGLVPPWLWSRRAARPTLGLAD